MKAQHEKCLQLSLRERCHLSASTTAPPSDIITLFDSNTHVFVTKWIKLCLLQCFGTFKMPILMFISILVFRPEGQIWSPVRRNTRIFVRRILNASRISKTQLNSCTISPS